MRCPNCGEELSDGVLFCRECGHKIQKEPQKRFCRECGSELESGAKFCSNCGAKVLTQADIEATPVEEASECEDETDIVTVELNPSDTGTSAGYFQRLWNKLDGYLKFCVIASAFFLFGLLIACIAHRPIAILVSIVQIGCFLASAGIRLGIIKTDKKWLHLVLLLVILVMFSPYFRDFKAKDESVVKETVLVVETTEATDATEVVAETTGEVLGAEVETYPSEISLGSEFSVDLVIDFHENWILNTYDVVLKIDDIQIDSLKHGKGRVYNLNLDNGQYVLKAISKDSPSIIGRANLNITEDCEITMKLVCGYDEIEISQVDYESRRKLKADEIRIWKSSDDYNKMTPSEAVADLQQTGFTNITSKIIRDASDSWGAPKSDTIKSITIDGKERFARSEVFNKDAEVVVTYHAMAYSQDEILSEFANHVGKPASDILAYFENTNCVVECYVENKKIDDFDPEGYVFLTGSATDGGKKVILNFSTPELIAMREKLENDFPEDAAKRAIVLSMTNAEEPEKVHKYTDMSGFYLSIYKSGTWAVVDEKTWHVENFECLMSGKADGIRVTCDVSIDGDNYILKNVKKATLSKDELKSGKSPSSYTHYDSEKTYSFLIVPAVSVKDARDAKEEKDRNNRTMPTDEREEWVKKQFRKNMHASLVSLIKENLNDEKSFEHKETHYYEVLTDDSKTYFNNQLAKMGYSTRVEIGDLVITCEFTAKNRFNATVKSIALGYVSYTTDMVYLVDIE